MPRTYTQAKMGEGARAAVQRAAANDSGGKPAGRRNRAGASGDDYERIHKRAVEVFSRDTIRDDGQDDTTLKNRPDEDDPQLVRARFEALKASGRADALRPQQGGIVATKKGRVVEWIVPADRTTKGTVAGSSARAAIAQRERFTREGLDYAERVDRRLRAIGGSWLGKAGSHEDVQAELRKAFIEDRRRRGWRTPDFSSLGKSGDDEDEDFQE